MLTGLKSSALEIGTETIDISAGNSIEAPAISATIIEWPNRLACRGHSTVGWGSASFRRWAVVTCQSMSAPRVPLTGRSIGVITPGGASQT
jgi:hypothetical protein